MNKLEIVELLRKCLSSDEKKHERNSLLVLIEQLEEIRKDVLNLDKLDLDLLSKESTILSDELDELQFYASACNLKDIDYQLTDEQIKRIQEMVDRYLNKIKEELTLVDKVDEKNRYLNELIEKILKDHFTLTGEELTYINKLLYEENIAVEKINQVMISLSLMVIRELEGQFYDKKDLGVQNDEESFNEKVDIESEHEEEKELVSVSSNLRERDLFIDKLWDLLNKYGYGELGTNLIREYVDDLRQTTNLEKIEDILKTLKELKINLSSNFSDMLRIKSLLSLSSGKIINNVVKMISDTMQMNNQESFDYVFDHIAIFINVEPICGYQNFIENMELFKSLDFDVELFKIIPIGILCEDSKKIRKNVLVLEKYKVPREKYLVAISVLKTGKNLSDELDTWLELSTTESECYLEENLSILVNNQIKGFSNKLRILRDLHVNITVKDTYKTLNKKLFQELDLLTIDDKVYLNGMPCEIPFKPYTVINEEYDKLMKKNKIDLLEDRTGNSLGFQKFINNIECINDLYYFIPGVNIKISKNKVFRVFNNLIHNGINNEREMLIYAIAYKSAISEEEYQCVCQFVDQIMGNSLEHKGSVR